MVNSTRFVITCNLKDDLMRAAELNKFKKVEKLYDSEYNKLI